MELARLLHPKAQTAAGRIPFREREILLCHCLGKNRAFLYANRDWEMPRAQLATFQHLCQERALGKPVAYLTGRSFFHTLELESARGVFIPRPETELLVESALSLYGEERRRVLELGTGSGAVALALGAARPRWQISAVEKEPQALRLAERNRRRLGLSNVHILPSDWCARLPRRKYHLALGNPPYIAAADPHLQRGDLRFEPRSALRSAQRGLGSTARIAAQLRPFLYAGAPLLLEHGWRQGQLVQRLLRRWGFRRCRSLRDLAGHRRVVLCYRD